MSPTRQRIISLIIILVFLCTQCGIGWAGPYKAQNLREQNFDSRTDSRVAGMAGELEPATGAAAGVDIRELLSGYRPDVTPPDNIRPRRSRVKFHASDNRELRELQTYGGVVRPSSFAGEQQRYEQYDSIVYFVDHGQYKEAFSMIQLLKDNLRTRDKIETDLLHLEIFCKLMLGEYAGLREDINKDKLAVPVGRHPYHDCILYEAVLDSLEGDIDNAVAKLQEVIRDTENGEVRKYAEDILNKIRTVRNSLTAGTQDTVTAAESATDFTVEEAKATVKEMINNLSIGDSMVIEFGPPVDYGLILSYRDKKLLGIKTGKKMVGLDVSRVAGQNFRRRQRDIQRLIDKRIETIAAKSTVGRIELYINQSYYLGNVVHIKPLRAATEVEADAAGVNVDEAVQEVNRLMSQGLPEVYFYYPMENPLAMIKFSAERLQTDKKLLKESIADVARKNPNPQEKNRAHVYVYKGAIRVSYKPLKFTLFVITDDILKAQEEIKAIIPQAAKDRVDITYKLVDGSTTSMIDASESLTKARDNYNDTATYIFNETLRANFFDSIPDVERYDLSDEEQRSRLAGTIAEWL